MRISDWSSDVCSSDLDNLKTHYPQLAQNLSPQGYALPRVASLCKSLLVERVPLRDFRKIAEAMVALSAQQLGEIDLVEAVRPRPGALIVPTIVPSRVPLPAVPSPPPRKTPPPDKSVPAP